MKCKECDTECSEMTAKTEKNNGKKFWSCPNRCKCWNGWVDVPSKSNAKAKPQIKYEDSDEDDGSSPTKKTVAKKVAPKVIPKKEAPKSMFVNSTESEEEADQATKPVKSKLMNSGQKYATTLSTLQQFP